VEKVTKPRHDFVKHKFLTLGLCGAFLLILTGVEGYLQLGNGPFPSRPAIPARPAQNASASGTLPLEGEVICLDPGHGGYDGGAKARDSGIWEKVINMAVAQKTATMLEELGARVVFTRTADYALCDEEKPKGSTKKRQDMERRIQLIKDEGCTMVISIHMNEFRNRSQSGPQVFFRKGKNEGRLLAGIMQQTLIEGLSPKYRRVAQSENFFILTLDLPSVLVECGFISNSAEEKLLLTDDYQQKIAKAITAGAAEYVQLAKRLMESQP
jgi:N-acetylmuramoyl-L-alanine amidase